MALLQRVPYDPAPVEVPNLHNMLVTGLLSACAGHTKDSTLKISCSVTVWLDAIRDRVAELLDSGKCDTYGKVLTAIYDEERERKIEKAVAAKVARGEVDGELKETGVEKGLGEKLTNLQLGGSDGGAPLAMASSSSDGGQAWTDDLERAYWQMRRDNVPGWRTKGFAQHKARENLTGNTMARQLHRALRKEVIENANICAREALDLMRKEMDEAKNQNAA